MAAEAAEADAAAESGDGLDAAEAELDRQAQAMAEKALEKLPEAIRVQKLPKVKEGILKRLKQQASATGVAPAGVVPSSSSQAAAAPEAPPPPPPAPPPEEEGISFLQLDDVEMCGDEPWFANPAVRRALRDRTIAAHAEQKILVGPAADEIRRICPAEGRVLGAGAVLRLGGARFGGFGESDINYAYRQLSRAIHPDKNPDVEEAPQAFRRLSEAADELRQGLTEARGVLQQLCTTMGLTATPEMLERPQWALFAEATRLLAALLALSGEGEVPGPAFARSMTAFAKSSAYQTCEGLALLGIWYEKTTLLDLFAHPALRTAYDCTQKHYRAHFLCLLNRVSLAEAKRQNECIRSDWQEVWVQFPELTLWQALRESLKKRVWTLDDASASEAPPEKKPRKSRFDELPAGKSSDPICWNFVTDGACKKGDRCRYLHQVPEGYDKSKASEARGRGRPNIIQKSKVAEEVKTSGWAKEWRLKCKAILAKKLEAVSVTDDDVRKLSAALWSDVAAWAATSDKGRQALGLFAAEKSSSAKWTYVPASDLFLVIGEGILGITCEGLVADNPLRHKRRKYEQLGKPIEEIEDEKEEQVGGTEGGENAEKAAEKPGSEVAQVQKNGPEETKRLRCGKAICRNWAAGICKFGNGCHFAHEFEDDRRKIDKQPNMNANSKKTNEEDDILEEWRREGTATNADAIKTDAAKSEVAACDASQQKHKDHVWGDPSGEYQEQDWGGETATQLEVGSEASVPPREETARLRPLNGSDWYPGHDQTYDAAYVASAGPTYASAPLREQTSRPRPPHGSDWHPGHHQTYDAAYVASADPTYAAVFDPAYDASYSGEAWNWSGKAEHTAWWNAAWQQAGPGVRDRSRSRNRL